MVGFSPRWERDRVWTHRSSTRLVLSLPLPSSLRRRRQRRRQENLSDRGHRSLPLTSLSRMDVAGKEGGKPLEAVRARGRRRKIRFFILWPFLVTSGLSEAQKPAGCHLTHALMYISTPIRCSPMVPCFAGLFEQKVRWWWWTCSSSSSFGTGTAAAKQLDNKHNGLFFGCCWMES